MKINGDTFVPFQFVVLRFKLRRGRGSGRRRNEGRDKEEDEKRGNRRHERLGAKPMCDERWMEEGWDRQDG